MAASSRPGPSGDSDELASPPSPPSPPPAAPPPSPRPDFRSARLRAEPVRVVHAPVMARVLADPRIHRFLDAGPPTEESLTRRYQFLEGGRSPDGHQHWLTWVLFPVTPDDGTAPSAPGAPAMPTPAPSPSPIGFVEATVAEPEQVNIAYVLHPDHWGRGLASEAITAMLDMVFDRFDVQRAVAEMDVENVASVALAESLGFRRIDTVPVTIERHGMPARPGHEHVYVVTRLAWRDRTPGGPARTT